MVQVTWRGYEYEVEVIGDRVVAMCVRTGHQKVRLCAGWWLNDHLDRVKVRGLVQALEGGVRQLQRERDRGRQYQRVTTMRTGHQRQGSVRVVRPKRREKRENGRVQ